MMFISNKCFNLNEIFNKINLISLILVFLSIITVSNCLYEDQIGKFDWKRNYVGQVKFAYLDSYANDRVIVATAENVLASLHAKSGEILWRQVFERSARGSIELLHVNTQQKGIMEMHSTVPSSDILTISGYNPSIIRSWNSNTGNLMNEWYLTPHSPEKAVHAFWFHHQNYLYHVIPVWGSHLEFSGYHPVTGQQKKTTTSKIIASWITKESCVLAKPFYACLVGNQILAVNLISEKSELVSKPLDQDIQEGSIQSIRGLDNAVLINDKIVHLVEPSISSSVKIGAAIFNGNDLDSDRNILIQAFVTPRTLDITSSYLESGESYSAINYKTDYAETFGKPQIYGVRCRSSSESKVPVCRILIGTEDGAIIMLQQGNVKWTREESLANIVAVQMIDLPLSDAEGAIENELNSKDGDIYSALFRRISGQIVHFKNLFQHVLGLGPPPSATQKAGLVRDAFGLHKIIVAVTSTGKVFGIDNISGKHHWVKYLPGFVAFNDDQHLKLFVQRTAKHFPNAPHCVIIGKDEVTGNGIVYQFNPVTGLPVSSGIRNLGYVVQQISLIHATGPDFIQGILFLDANNRPHVLPETSAKYAHNFHIFTANKKTGDLAGFLIEYTNNQLNAIPTWKINLSGASNSQKIIAVAVKNHMEHVHSQGRVLGDRSVLYKYINPNLVAIATHGPDAIHKYVLNIHLVDIVSGAVVSSLTHRRIKEPLHIIHSENWMVYSYYNEKFRRTEITSIELYEGKTQTNSTVWSSLDAPPQPMVERQAYIFPSPIASIKETITEKGITNKHVLIGLTSGAIVEMPWTLLDPRRPVTLPNQAREEGVIPYIPELPIPQEHIINYNQSVVNIRDIYTAASGLESTCLVFVHGLDMFVTRVAPSKTFDLLKDDFDYFLISVVLIALTTASYVVKHLSSRKALKQAWK